MARKKVSKETEKVISVETELKIFRRPSRQFVPCSFEEPAGELVTVPGKSQTILQLYTDFVMGKLDPRQIGGNVAFDDPKSEDVDPFNTFGLSLEEVDALRQENERTIAQERKNGNRKTVANASTGTKQDNPQTGADIMTAKDSPQDNPPKE